MLARRLSSLFRSSQSSKGSGSAKPSDDEKSKSYVCKAVSFVLIMVTGGVALSALHDLAIYHSCSRLPIIFIICLKNFTKAKEKASKNQAIIKSIGEPIKKGPWYNASLEVTHKRHSVSCTFPVSGPQGNGVFQLKAVQNGDSWFSSLQPQKWEILIMDALLRIPENEGKQQTMRISISDNLSPSASTPQPQEKQWQQ